MSNLMEIFNKKEYDKEYQKNIINKATINDTTKADEFLTRLIVDEKYRRNKIGVKLIDKSKIWSKEKGCKYIELSVCNGNSIAINLYKKEGFKDNKTIMFLNLEEE